MSHIYKGIVLGAGVIGGAGAYFMSKAQGKDVAYLEQADHPATKTRFQAQAGGTDYDKNGFLPMSAKGVFDIKNGEEAWFHPERGIYAGPHTKQLYTQMDEGRIPLKDTVLPEFFKREKASSVIDVGGGDGCYTTVLNSKGIFASCYEGNPDAQHASNGVCAVLDFTEKIQLAKYDWVFCYRVGMTLNKKYHKRFIQNLAQVAKNGIVISWSEAIHELKTGEVIPTKAENALSHKELIKELERFGFSHDPAASEELSSATNHKPTILVLRKTKQ